MDNLKNIRQIGSPAEADKIYMEAAVYDRLHEEENAEKRVFVLMGHTECEEHRYATFIESVIPVRDICFERNVPHWDNRVWNEVFREIKNSYEDSVVVGWAVDRKGAAMAVTEELEAVHREQFGGTHQLLLLMDSLEPEERFYQVKNNHLRAKEGFYIYYNQKAKPHVPTVQLEIPAAEEFFRRKTSVKPQEEERAAAYNTTRAKARYRKLQQETSESENTNAASRFGTIAAAVLFAAILGTALSKSQILSVFSQKVSEQEESGAEAATQDDGWTISLVEVSGGTVVGSEEPQSGSTEADEGQETAGNVQEPISYTVQKGDTLLEICRRQYGSADRLEEVEQMNGITDPDAIYVGQQLQLPQ